PLLAWDIRLNRTPASDGFLKFHGLLRLTELFAWTGSLLRIKENLIAIDAGLFKQVEIQEVTGDSNPRQL
ncbi:hypothetical protein FCV25MIE_16010, partial [Fagus crenata]